MKKIIVNSVVILVGIAIGVSAGWLLRAVGFFQEPDNTHYFMLTGIACGVSENAFEADASDAKELLQKSLFLLDNGMDSHSRLDPSMKKALQLQAAFAKARLSILEKKSGNAERAVSYMSAAQADLKSLGWRDYSAAHIEKEVQPHRVPAASTPSVKPASTQLPAAQMN